LEFLILKEHNPGCQELIFYY